MGEESKVCKNIHTPLVYPIAGFYISVTQDEKVESLKAIADSVAVAMEAVGLGTTHTNK